MKIISVAGIILFGLFSHLSVYPILQNEDMLEEAILETNPANRLHKMEKYYISQLEKRQPIDKNFYPHMVATASQLNMFDKVILHGEQAIKLTWNNEFLKLQIYFYIANAYFNQKVNLNKAVDYTDLVIDSAKKLVDDPKETDGEKIKTLFISCLKLQIQIFKELDMSPILCQQALNRSFLLFHLDSESAFAQGEVYYFALILYQRFYLKETAINALAEICTAVSAPTAYHKTLAFWYSQNQNNEKAIFHLKTAYSRQKDAGVAYSLAKLLQETHLDEAIDYLAESYLMNDSRISPKAKQLLDHLFFNIKNEKLSPEEKEKNYQELLKKTKKKLTEG